MSPFADPEVIRPINIVVSLTIVGVLSFRHFRRPHPRIVDDRLRSFAAVSVFAVMAFGSGVNYHRGVQMGPIVPYFTLTLLFYLLALLAPWRWGSPRFWHTNFIWHRRTP